jgi:cardiolipin synthase
MTTVRQLADQAFSRAAGAALIEGNSVRLLRDARENYPAWLEAIGSATRHIHFENYIFYDDETGARFADALIGKALAGVRVRLIYDWLGCIGSASRAFWNRLRSGGVEVRCYNPPRLESPLAWLSRDHRKMLAVDGVVGFITGLCVGRRWEGMPEKNVEPWRDTGIEVHGPAVAEIEASFAQIWAMTGNALPREHLVDKVASGGNVALRIVATAPATAGLFRLDQLVAALARQRLWLTDAYYAGTPAFVEGLRAAAKDGVDVRLLMPSASDVLLVQPLSRTGYRPLLEAGVRVFEWNGTMLHAKTAVADGRWARVGSTNLNIASWFGNCELDAVIEDKPFAQQMEQMYLEDLANATEVVLDERSKPRAPGRPPHRRVRSIRGGGSAGRAAAGAVRIGNAIGAVFTNRRSLGPIEARIALTTGVLLCALSIVFALFPQVLAYPLVVIAAWGGVALVYRAYRLHRARRKEVVASVQPASKT